MVDTLIVALGAGLNFQTPQDPPYLWAADETVLRAAAAGKIWNANANGTIICSGGRPGGPGTPSEGDAMADYVSRSPWNVPPQSILTEHESIDTADNVGKVAVLMQREHLSSSHIILIAGRRNITRATRYFKAYGIIVIPRLAKEILGNDIDALGLPHVNDALTMQSRIHEAIMLFMQLFDRKGKLVTAYRRWQLRDQV